VRYYRIYGLGLGGRFISMQEVQRDTDDQALDVVRGIAPAGEFELWEQGRFVARVKTGGAHGSANGATL
jgi:hypothetical protein